MQGAGCEGRIGEEAEFLPPARGSRYRAYGLLGLRYLNFLKNKSKYS
jgi:hypothetical protein